jgi:uncharacterized membrane protein
MRNTLQLILKFLKNSYHKALRSIAFYPVLISFGLFCLALSTLAIERWDLVSQIKQKVPYLFITDIDTARDILSTLIGGILSLTVFSFTMVMVVLSQASSNFSPRLLPGLVSNRRHQLILGFYVGTLIYCIIILISLGAYVTAENTIGLSVTTAAVLGVLCVGLFVSFIHNISAAVQIQNIIGELYHKTDKNLEKALSEDGRKIPLRKVGDSDWHEIKSIKTGYFQQFEPRFMGSNLEKRNVQVLSVNYPGQHIWDGDTLFKTNEPLSDEEISSLLFCCHISEDLHDGDHAYLALIKLMEIAVRAMSPGVNDPGTATSVVHKLGYLMSKMVQLPNFTSESIKPDGVVVFRSMITIDFLFENIIQPIRYYGKKDVRVLKALLDALVFLHRTEHITEEDRERVLKEIDACSADAKQHIENELDLRTVLEY